MQMNVEKCYPKPAELKQINDGLAEMDGQWLEALVAKWQAFSPSSLENLPLALARLCQQASLASILECLNQQLDEVPEELLPILLKLEPYLEASCDEFEKNLKAFYLTFWYQDFKCLVAQTLKLNDQDTQDFCENLDRHLGEQSTISAKSMHLESLFEYYAFLKSLRIRKPTEAVQCILLSAFVDQASRCSAGLIVLLNQQIASIFEPINLSQFMVQYSTSLIEFVSQNFKDEVDVHQKNYIFAYARKLGYPTRDAVDDPHIVPAFDDFQSVISQLHFSFYKQYHFFGVLNYVSETILEKLTLNCEYQGLLTEENAVYESSKVSDMYAYLAKYTALPKDISYDVLKHIFVTKSKDQMVCDEVLLDILGIDNNKLILLISQALLKEQIFFEDANWRALLETYFDETKTFEVFPVFENIFHLAYFYKNFAIFSTSRRAGYHFKFFPKNA